jgi:hypothetical protein
MRILLVPALLLVLLIGILPTASAASAVTLPTRADVERFALARGADARELLLGPTQPEAAIPGGMDCADLYLQRMALTRAGLDHRPTFWEDRRHPAAIFVGAIWTPGFYYLPFRAVTDLVEDSRAPQREADLEALRARSALLRCYER